MLFYFRRFKYTWIIILSCNPRARMGLLLLYISNNSLNNYAVFCHWIHPSNLLILFCCIESNHCVVSLFFNSFFQSFCLPTHFIIEICIVFLICIFHLRNAHSTMLLMNVLFVLEMWTRTCVPTFIWALFCTKPLCHQSFAPLLWDDERSLCFGNSNLYLYF